MKFKRIDIKFYPPQGVKTPSLNWRLVPGYPFSTLSTLETSARVSLEQSPYTGDWCQGIARAQCGQKHMILMMGRLQGNGSGFKNHLDK